MNRVAASAAAARHADELPERGVGHLLREASRTFNAAMQQRLAAHRITLSQWLHLRTLYDYKGMTQSALSKYLGVEKASSTAVLNYLDAQQLIRRVRNNEDRRITNLELTARGTNLVRKLVPRAVELNAAARRGLSRRDFITFIRVLMAITENLQGPNSTQQGRRPAPDRLQM